MKEKALEIVEKLKKLDREMASVDPGDTFRLTAMAKERKRWEPIVLVAEEFLKIDAELNQLKELIEGDDRSVADLARAERLELEEKLRNIEAKLVNLLVPSDSRADRDTIVEIRAGAGGDEAGLFVGDLFRMYTRFAQSKDLEVYIYSLNPQGVGGFKEVVFGVSGPNAYGWMKYEQGVHRVQRVPETEAQGRIHTSTATVAVLTEPTDVEIKIDARDLRIDTYRASGAGGQHVNKTESAVRITHLPSGFVVSCQEERSQAQNRMRAMTLLRAKLQGAAEEKKADEQRELRRKQVGSGDRSEKIRTYNFPQDRITDHRINFSVFNMERFLSGEMDEMISALKAKENELLKSGNLS